MMEIDEIQAFCLDLPYSTEEYPFDLQTAVFKVCGKIFCILALDTSPAKIGVKNTPYRNLELREQYEQITGAYHMNKVHWSTLSLEFPLQKSLVFELIKESYDLVWSKLPLKFRNGI